MIKIDFKRFTKDRIWFGWYWNSTNPDTAPCWRYANGKSWRQGIYVRFDIKHKEVHEYCMKVLKNEHIN